MAGLVPAIHDFGEQRPALNGNGKAGFELYVNASSLKAADFLL
jgi:hypothetical protein